MSLLSRVPRLRRRVAADQAITPDPHLSLLGTLLQIVIARTSNKANFWLIRSLRTFKSRITCKRGDCFAPVGLAMTAGGGDCFAPEPVPSQVLPVPSVPRGACRRVVEGGLAMTAGGRRLLRPGACPEPCPACPERAEGSLPKGCRRKARNDSGGRRLLRPGACPKPCPACPERAEGSLPKGCRRRARNDR
jgi:hypothetical protein